MTEKTQHQRLFDKAKQAVDDLFSDMSVDQETTVESLYRLIDEINVLIEAIESDLHNQKR